MEAVMGIYEDFYATYYHDGTFGYNGTRQGTFHYGLNRFATVLNACFPGKRIAYVWNNIVKIGKAQGTGFCGAVRRFMRQKGRISQSSVKRSKF